MTAPRESRKDRWSNEPWPAAFDTLTWWRKVLCRLHICQGVFDGHDWDGGWHCKHCLRDWA
jgi:hypothetical protein